MSYMTISSQENHNFSLCSCFHAHPTTLLLKILGGGPMHGRPPPPQILGGTVPPSPPLGLRPCLHPPMSRPRLRWRARQLRLPPRGKIPNSEILNTHFFVPIALETLGPINIAGHNFLSELGRS